MDFVLYVEQNVVFLFYIQNREAYLVEKITFTNKNDLEFQKRYFAGNKKIAFSFFARSFALSVDAHSEL